MPPVTQKQLLIRNSSLFAAVKVKKIGGKQTDSQRSEGLTLLFMHHAISMAVTSSQPKYFSLREKIKEKL